VNVESGVDVYRQVIDAVNRGDLDALDVLMTDDLIDHNPIPGQPPGREGFKEWMSSVRTSFPDLVGTVDDCFGAGDKVAGRVSWRGTQRGPFAGLPPSNRPVAFQAFHIVRFEDDRITEWWGIADIASAIAQITG
jgi:steroid delta-isomerase-like uncharacterized protein